MLKILGGQVNGEEVSRIDAGQFLGEVGLLLGERRIADVRCVILFKQTFGHPVDTLVLGAQLLFCTTQLPFSVSLTRMVSCTTSHVLRVFLDIS